MLDKVPKCCGTKISWQVLAPSCLIKYDNVMFYQLISQTSTPGKLYYYIIYKKVHFLDTLKD
jgi:hypothetical protein